MEMDRRAHSKFLISDPAFWGTGRLTVAPCLRTYSASGAFIRLNEALFRSPRCPLALSAFARDSSAPLGTPP
jgi:hypothetical protein